MKEVFISWAGKESEAIASSLKTTLEKIFENEDFSAFMSEKDIHTGTEWFQVIKSHLINSCCTIVILTKENIDAPWILFESGAMAGNHEEKLVIPILFDVNVNDKSPLANYNHINFSKTAFKKMIRDIAKFCGFDKMSPNQLNTVIGKEFEMLNNNIANNVKNLKDIVFFGSSYVYPKSIRAVTKKSVFISSPMNSSKNDNEYKELRQNILSLIDEMKDLDFSKIIYPGENIESKDKFEGENIAIDKNFKKLKSSECVLAIYPNTIASSILIEIGYAIALTKKLLFLLKIQGNFHLCYEKQMYLVM